MEPTKNPQNAGCELRASDVVGRYPKTSTTAPASAPRIIDRCIIIGRGIGNLYLVSVDPPHPDHEPQIFDGHKQARGYAGGLRMCHRWQIVDQTGDGQ